MPMTEWYAWPNAETFNIWHSRVIAGLGLPRVGFNAANDAPDPEAQQTIAYTAPITTTMSGETRAPVEAHIAAQFNDGLGAPSTQPPQPESNMYG